MAHDLDLATEELARLMSAHNRWSARVARLQIAAASLEGTAAGDGPGAQWEALQATLEQLQTALAQAQFERNEALSSAQEWERKARDISRQIAAERLSKGKQLMELRQRIAELERSSG